MKSRGILSASKLEDCLEHRDPKIRAHIPKNRADRRAGKGRLLSGFLAEIAPQKRSVPKSMANAFSVPVTPHYERLAKELLRAR